MYAFVTDASRHFLVVDDDPIFLAVAETVLKSLGAFEVSIADDGDSGLDLLRTTDTSIDTIILDLNMPRLDGLAFLRAAADAGYDGDVVISSGESASIVNAARHLANQLGIRIAGSLSKPITPEAVTRILSGLRPLGRGGEKPRIGDDLVGMEGRIEAFYQPQCDLRTGDVVGLEALARFVTTDGRVLGPEKIFGSDRSSSQIIDATFDIIVQVFGDLRRWQDLGKPRRVSINMDAKVLEDSATLLRILSMQQEYGVDPRFVVFEMTETALPYDLSRLIEILTRLRMKGFGVSLDDFGTGAANFELLRMCPFSELKIDRSIIQSADREAASHRFIQFCVDTARELGIEIVAEGLETPEHCELCLSLGVKKGQGFFFDRPMATPEIETRF